MALLTAAGDRLWLRAPAALLTEPALPPLTGWNIAGFAYMTFIGAGLTYLLWFRGIDLLGPSAIPPLGLLSPLMAVILGWAILDQTLSAVQIAGMVLVLGSVLVGQYTGQLAQRRPAANLEGTPAGKPG
ncbi:EamA family transporter [Pannonibacter indicus]|uniref:EamA family transporter n=1 Tax=Pannonibacter indicus TaxID=466044 RepID=UPI000B044D4C|nr:EamA family transporter [Pannonibacter indicus]